jgi:hypothetical protein
MLDLQAMILRSPTPQGVGIIPERSPSPLRLERPPVPLLARRSSPLERGAAVTNRPEPSLTVSMQVSCNLSMSPRLAATFTRQDEICYVHICMSHIKDEDECQERRMVDCYEGSGKRSLKYKLDGT